MNRYKYFFTILSLGLAGISSAQNCGSDQAAKDWVKQSAANEKSYMDYLEELSTINTAAQGRGSSLNKKEDILIIPVVFHIVHNFGPENISKAQILEQIEILNQDYRRLNSDTTKTRDIFKGRAADIGIEFRLANIDPNGNCTDGITRTQSLLTYGGDEEMKKVIGWDYRKYLNVWVIHHIGMQTEDGIVAGYARFPYQTSSLQDGIVLNYQFVGKSGTSNSQNAGRTLTHEIGHWLGLMHPFQDGCGGDCATTGDRVCDTPPVEKASFGCPIGNNSCDNDDPDELDMVENYMDYANGSCQNMFTQGQKEVMRYYAEQWNYRGANVTPDNLVSTGALQSNPCAPVADFYTVDAITQVCQGSSIQYKDYSWNGTVKTWEWTFEGGSPATSNLPSPTVTYANAGKYKVSLKVTNDLGESTLAREEFITIIQNGGVWASPFTETFDGEYSQALWNGERSGKYGWQIQEGVSYTGSKSMMCYVDNTTSENTTYTLYSPYFDLTRHTGLNPKLSMHVAYSLRKSGSSDKLIVYASKDCGHNWITLRSYTGTSTLASKSGYNPAFEPKTTGDWITLEMDLNRSGLDASNSVILKFEFISGDGGNQLYIDDINVDQFSLSLNPNIINSVVPKVYPNPNTGTFEISTSGISDNVRVEIVNALGEVVESTLINGESVKTFNLTTTGIYFIKTSGSNFSTTSRIVVTR
ncbi:MAG: T9SS type A sorting domain-containing protein [Bacteroidetes bacterium]|nr:T9SS type A sorting domain-containing protein [Bacteroidota bacterium]